eukprot:6687515-Pyramimonas_sp.AAC.2
MVLWRLPPALKWLAEPGVNLPWLQRLGERGPWLADRLIGATELPADMDADGKVTALCDSVRRMTMKPGGGVDVSLHEKVRGCMLSWASDGADRSVGAAAAAHFPSMVFREWEESHSA